jgi:very-short-patch-repair endonuclease
MEVTGTPEAFQRARKLRREMTKPERLLWWALKADKTGFHFRRQHAAGPYVLDFYCERARLCVEVDGSSHDFTTAHDEARDRYLSRWGILTLRVPAREVLTNLQGVVELITETVSTRPLRQSEQPLPLGAAVIPDLIRG